MKRLKNFLLNSDAKLSGKCDGASSKTTLDSNEQNEEYKEIARKTLDTSLNIFHSSDNWKLEKRTNEGDVIYSKYIDGVGKVFKLTAEVNFPPEKLCAELLDNSDNTPTWNPTLTESRVIQKIDENTKVNYQLSADAGGGLVARREFLTLMHKEVRDGIYVTTGPSITHTSVPVSQQYIRGEIGPNCWIFQPIPGSTDRCKFQWLQNINLKGWLPQYLIDVTMTTFMLEYLQHIRTHGEKLKQQEQRDM